MVKLGTVALAVSIAGVASANFAISIGLRETHAGGGPEVAIGANGGSLGGIEWVNLDVNSIALDGNWHQITFDLTTATFTGFAGGTANGTLTGNYGVLENIRIVNTGGHTGAISVWVDDVVNTITPAGGSATNVVLNDFEAATLGTEVMFQEPGFSGSTSANLMAGSVALVDNNAAASGSQSVRGNFRFVDGTPTRWVRWTTFNTVNQGNPLVRFDQSSKISFNIRAVPEPGTMAVLGLGLAALVRRKRK